MGNYLASVARFLVAVLGKCAIIVATRNSNVPQSRVDIIVEHFIKFMLRIYLCKILCSRNKKSTLLRKEIL